MSSRAEVKTIPTKCQYSATGDSEINCKPTPALKYVYDDMEGEFPIGEIREMLCCNPDEEARMQCPAYALLIVGAATDFVKRG